MKLERTDGIPVQGKKRQYMPFRLKWTCPACGREQVHDFSDHRYLSYPEFGKPREVALFCENDECNVDMEPVRTIQVVPKLDMEIDDKGDDYASH